MSDTGGSPAPPDITANPSIPAAARRPLAAAVVFAAYVLLSLLLFCRSADWSHFVLTDAAADPWSSIWFLNWWPWSVLHGQFGQTSHAVFAPYGYDLAWATPIPTAALLALPITLSLGAADSYNALTLLAPALGASTTFLLIRRGLGGSLAAGALGGALYGFSPYETGQMNGHLNLDLTFLIPLACLAVSERLAGRLGRAGFIGSLTTLLLLQFGISAELFATLVTLGGAVWVVFTCLSPPPARGRHGRIAAEAAAALALTALILSPVLWHMAGNATQFPDFINPPWLYSTNLANVVIPTTLTILGGSWLAPVSAHFTGNPSEQGGYLGLPLLALLALLARERFRHRMVAALLIALVCLAVASLGPSLHAGAWDSHVPMPWWIATHLPLLRGAAPSRISLYVSLCAAVAAALWHDTATTTPGRAWRLTLVAFCLLSWLPFGGGIPWLELPLLPFFEPAQARAALGDNANVLVLPYLQSDQGGATPAMLWQWQSGMAFRQAGGYLSFVPLPAARLQFVQHLIHNEPSMDFGNDIAAFVAQNKVAAVLAGPGTSAALRRALDGLGWRRERKGGVDLFRVPPADSLRYVSLTGNIWYAYDVWSLLGHEATVTTHGRAATLLLNDVIFPMPATVVTLSRQDGAQTRYPVGAHASLSIKLPESGTFRVRTDATFQPKRCFPQSRDDRELSFYIRLQPD